VQKIKIVLKSGKEQSIRRYHPWIFSGAIKMIYGVPLEGDIVTVFDNNDDFLAVGHYQPGSIAVRILSFEDIEPDIEFFRSRIKNAIEFRKSLGLIDNKSVNVFRLIHAEGDNLPGLIADFYNGVIVMQMHSVGMYRIRKEITEILAELMGKSITAIYDKSESTIPFKAESMQKMNFYSEIQGRLWSLKTDLNSKLTGPPVRKQDFLLISAKTESC